MQRIDSDKWKFIIGRGWQCAEHGRFLGLLCKECWELFPSGIYVNLYRKEVSTLDEGGIVEFDNFLMYDDDGRNRIVMFDWIVNGRRLCGDEEIPFGEVSRKYSEPIEIDIKLILEDDK